MDESPLAAAAKPYRYASKVSPVGDCHPMIAAPLLARLEQYFPGTAIEADYGWSGVLGVSRDWCAAVSHDRETGIGASTGYAGHGVGSSNLGARALDLVLQRDTEVSHLPLVNRRSPNWEPEPIRWTGVQSMYRLVRTADAGEERTHARDLADSSLREDPHWHGMKPPVIAAIAPNPPGSM
jgi:hypothetical protein